MNETIYPQHGDMEHSIQSDSLDRISSGRAAESSGRCHAVQEEGESWDQEEFAKYERKKPPSVMVEFPSGSNVWYNGVPQKWTSKEVLFRIGVESRDEPPCVWIRLTSSRIWRGSNAGNIWTYSGRGSWRPKGGRAGKKDKGGKGRAKTRKRKAADEIQGSDPHEEMTCTTKATLQPESDEEEDVTGQCPSPLPFKGSNAVSPEGEGAKPSFRRQQHDQVGADMLKILADKLTSKGDREGHKFSSTNGLSDVKFSSWLYRHYCLLEKQGQLNLAPEGCNPEAGRPSSLLFLSKEGSQGLKETSSSSGSAWQRHEASHISHSKAEKGQILTKNERKGQAIAKVGRNKNKPYLFEAPRSPSPSTPSKPADGSRRQRSSSADVEPQSLNAGTAMLEKEAKGLARASETHHLEPTFEQQGWVEDGADKRASAKISESQQARESSLQNGIPHSLKPASALNRRGPMSKAQDAAVRRRAKAESNFQQDCALAAGIKQPDVAAGKPVQPAACCASASGHESKDGAELARDLSVPEKGFLGIPVPGLAETDPFAKNDSIRCKAC